MHTSVLAFEAPFVCALVTFAAAIVFFYSWRASIRPWYVLVAVGGWLSWTIFFALLAISAGPAPMLEREHMVPMLRLSELLGGLMIATWLAFWVRGIWRNPFHISSDNNNYLREDGC